MKGSNPPPPTKVKPKPPANPPARVSRLTSTDRKPAAVEPQVKSDGSAAKLKKRVQVFLELHDKIAALDADYNARHKELIEQYDAAQADLLGDLNVAGLDSLKGPETGGRTIKKDRKVVATIDNFDAIWAYMKENDVPELLQKRLSTKVVAERQEAGDVIPGVGKFEKITLKVTK